MDNLIFYEMQAKEYRNDRSREAKKHNLSAHIKTKNFSLRLYESLSNIGARIANLGEKVESYYNCLVIREKRNMLANSSK